MFVSLNMLSRSEPATMQSDTIFMFADLYVLQWSNRITTQYSAPAPASAQSTPSIQPPLA